MSIWFQMDSRNKNYFQRLSKALEFAVSEWVLMFLLFIDVCFAYLIAKFASYCGLEGPCVLCSRYDHVVAKDKTVISLDSICNHHKSKVSSLVLCHVHDKLVDINGICENCLVSFTNKTNNAETLRLLVGKMGSNPFRNLDSSNSRICFCCNEPRDHVKTLVPTVSDASESLSAIDKKIFVDKSLESHNQIAPPSQVMASELHLKSDEELQWRKDANKEEMPQITAPADGTNETMKEPVTATNGHLDLGDAYKMAIRSKGRQLSGKLLDQKSFLLSHRSNEALITPKLSINSDEGMQFLQKRVSLERNESSVSIDSSSIVSEIDGETVVDRLKRQVEHDKKLIGVLYKELEEERNASAVATNQAMAMITRLQEEKAALYTEALQYLRMTEEQVEYNSEALQKANDLVENKEKHIQELLTKMMD